ncbi:hypothetical protein BC826DRAFT_1081964 [Russula brevipes]|nr:hypothetical protein BC826DRAFT_1081964 [Russula brevipes]
MDWPPIGPALFLADENYLQDEGIGVQENADNSIPTRKPSLPPVEKSDWTYPDHSPLVSPIIAHSSLDRSPARVLDGREFSHSVAAHAEASKTIADSCTPGPVVPDDDLSAQSLPPTNPSLVSALAVSDRRRDILSTLDPDASRQNCSGVTGIPTNLASRYAPLQPFHIRRQPPLANPEPPVFSKFTFPPFSLPPAAFHKRQNVPGHPGTMIDSVSRDPLCNSPLNSAPNHVVHPTGNA